jgi:nucleotide-binding universal stress UspA family protein
MINKILVAIDRSEKSNSVFDSAVLMAKTTGATLMLLHILSEDDPDYPILPTYAYYPLVDDREYDYYQEQLDQYKQWSIDFLNSLTQKAIEMGIDTEYTQLSGNPGRIICELASNWSADLIVVGNRGLKGLKEMFLGSVSNYVTHHAPCSILIVRTPIESELDSSIKITNSNSQNTQSLRKPRRFKAESFRP